MSFTDDGAKIQCHGCGRDDSLPSSWIGGPHRWQCPSCAFVHKVVVGDMAPVLIKVEAVTIFKEPVSLRRMNAGVAADFREGIRAANAGCPRAATVMIRRGLERACLDAGADKRLPLFKKIEKLEADGFITKLQAGSAHLVRSIANQYGAHPEDDGLDDVSAEELETLVRLAVAVVEGIARKSHDE